MRFPWLIAVCLLVMILAAVSGWFLLRDAGRRAGRRGWVANSGYVRELPKYRALVRRQRWALLGAVMCVLGLALATSVTAAAPVDRHLEDERLASRDIILCLDASGSMLPYDGAIADSFDTITDHFSGERISLHLWSAQTMTLFPLTDDYAMASETLGNVATLMKTGYLGQDLDGVYVSRELSDFLEPTVDPTETVSSLSGDGLAGCVLGFDRTNTERSRLVVLATDNEVLGSEIYTLSQAIDLAKQQGVTVIGLYPGNTSVLPSEGEELRDLVRSTGGDFYDAKDPGSVDGIISDIESHQRVDLEGSTVVETDRPEGPLTWVVVALIALLAIAAWFRL